jgi:hypothetical protein
MVNRIKKAKKWVSAIKSMGSELLGPTLSRAIGAKAVGAVNAIPAFKKGGKVRKTGLAKLHKNEIVLSAPQVKALKKIMNQ